MAKKILFCASTASHIKNFHTPYLAAFAQCGYEVFTATGDTGEIAGAQRSFTLPFYKSFFSFKNIRAIFAARRLLLKEHFDIVSLHTTLAAAVVRAALLTIPKRRRPRVFYTCHGYLFGENDGFTRLKYLLPEMLCAKVTDVLMVMNREDERIAHRYRLSGGSIQYINGMGLSPERFTVPTPEQHITAKEALGFLPEQLLFVYIAEFSKRKNHHQLLAAFAAAAPHIPNARLLLAGTGALLEDCRQLVSQLGVIDQVCFLGYVHDTPTLLAGCDVCVSTSLIEGLPFNIMEAMASGLTVIASDIKGHRELAECHPNFTLFDKTSSLTDLLAQSGQLPFHRHPAALTQFMLPQVLPELMHIYLGEEIPEYQENCLKAGVK
ncbi:glycosyltransferase [Oscillospiraceae bacterium LTW-04]|nr:glycosyltransferase [Oscillospiraceae bacterium MB24-C1]